jgi:DtxR family Mn-dependent transcriptional regulator
MDKSKNIISHEKDGQELIENFPISFFSHAQAIYHLQEVGIELKKTRVADWLESSRANVSQVIGRMQNSGLVSFGENLKLTEKGLCLAKIITRRHRITERFLSEVLNLPWEEVYKESSRWENVLSPVTEKAMLDILGNPTTGPFGNPIPYSNYKEKKMYPILDVDPKNTYLIEKITEELKRDRKTISFLQNHHMIPGNKIKVADSGDFSITISTNNNDYFGIDKYIAKRVFVV